MYMHTIMLDLKKDYHTHHACTYTTYKEIKSETLNRIKRSTTS